MKIYRLLPLFIFFLSCKSPQAIYDYDEKAEFTAYSTYAIYPGLYTGLSQLDERRLIGSLEGQLQQEGLSPSENPDLFVNVYSEEFRQDNNSRLGVGVGGTGRNVGVGVSGGIPIGGPETFLRLTFDFIDARTDALVWQAVMESSFDLNADPSARQKRFDQIVQKALAGYPPKR